MAHIPLDQRPLDDYLEAVKLEKFQENDESVIMIEPDIDIQKKFEEVDLDCNQEDRINNQISARVRDPNETRKNSTGSKLKAAPP